MVKIRHWTRPNAFKAQVNENDFKLVEEDLSEDLQQGEVLLESVYLSVDPYMRIYGDPIGEHKTMVGEACLKVIKTRNGEFPLGTLVLANSGWRSHYLSKDGKDLRSIPFDLGSLSPSLSLGVLGWSGLTAYFGLRILEPKAGEICVVNGAAGAVGSLVGQLAKQKDLIVIGFAGSDEKCNWLTNDLKFDYAFNYKKISLEDAFKKAAPKGVDVFFDNVGGDFFHEMVTKHMATHGRISICGSISNYNDTEKHKFPQINMDILMRELTIHGFRVFSFAKEYDTAFNDMVPLVKKGELICKETVFEGFEKMPAAFVGLFKGENTGKAVVKASSYP
ncbi:unnamed protein product [Adineta steineri]|uniref:15-oxoprostaglandin 13-reductase n=1 Tax=Adineta steineri TaxID=433720 RepID=A0A819MJ26_9BILA|nr:unnamed protein product [Adineta steineri]